MSVSVCLWRKCIGSRCMPRTQRLRQPAKLKPSYDPQQTWPPPKEGSSRATLATARPSCWTSMHCTFPGGQRSNLLLDGVTVEWLRHVGGEVRWHVVGSIDQTYQTRHHTCSLIYSTTVTHSFIYTYFFIGPILWGHSGPLCHALSLLLLLSLWTSILHCHSPGVATVARHLRYSYSWLWLILVVVS